MRRSIHSGLLICIALLSSTHAENKSKEAADLITRTKQISDIRADGAPAFHLKAQIRITKSDGTTNDGTYTEDWASPEMWRTEITAGNFRQTEIAKDRKVSILSTDPLLTDFISPRITAAHEHLLAFHLDGNWLLLDEWKPSKIEDRTAGSLSLRCINVSSPWGWEAALCFDRNNGTIQAKSTTKKEAPYGCTYGDYQNFGEKLFPRSIECFEAGRLALQTKIVELVNQPSPAPTLFCPLAGARDLTYCPHEGFPAKVLSANMPSFRVPAPVAVSFIVGPDAKPHDPVVTRSGGAEADKEALRGLPGWQFKAATCDGTAVASEMEIVVPGLAGGPWD